MKQQIANAFTKIPFLGVAAIFSEMTGSVLVPFLFRMELMMVMMNEVYVYFGQTSYCVVVDLN